MGWTGGMTLGLQKEIKMKHVCPICNKRVPRAYNEAHKRFHQKKTLDKVIIQIGKEKKHGTVSV